MTLTEVSLGPETCGWHSGRMQPGGGSWASSATARKVMLGNRSRDTKPELAVRRRLHAMGLRFRVAYRPEPALRRTADIVFTRRRLAVFIDGCYWHACPLHGTASKSNSKYWAEKLAGNVARDADTTAQLQSAGWTVLRFWEHESPSDVAEIIRRAVETRLDTVPASAQIGRSAAPKGMAPSDRSSTHSVQISAHQTLQRTQGQRVSER